jgi:hypothetical protein
MRRFRAAVAGRHPAFSVPLRIATVLLLLLAAMGTGPARAAILAFEWSGPGVSGAYALPERPAFPGGFVPDANYLPGIAFWRTGVAGRLTLDGEDRAVDEQLGGVSMLISATRPGGGVDFFEYNLLGPQLFSGPLSDPVFIEGVYTLESDEAQPKTFLLRIVGEDAAPIGEPPVLALLGVGVVLLIGARRRNVTGRA